MLSIDDERPPFAFVLIEGTAVSTERLPAELLPWSTRIAKRYMGAERADAFGKRNAVAGDSWDLIETFLAADFSGAERHLRRLSKVASPGRPRSRAS